MDENGKFMGCEIQILTHINSRGHIPKAFVNMMISRAPRQWEKTFVAACQHYEKHGSDFSNFSTASRKSVEGKRLSRGVSLDK